MTDATFVIHYTLASSPKPVGKPSDTGFVAKIQEDALNPVSQLSTRNHEKLVPSRVQATHLNYAPTLLDPESSTMQIANPMAS
ncbi:hypothetical protein M407DRAFT_30711 [Tulasnella calospora MUT 4182]|uniref:Uncharacterized protein n=1 Tax=Tulasnella calospora MUT 4182 TaxID=1051891 RepID=A0A0C3PX46_9AGAM|nr:hypothetical protein M407DRAFT_30711 [Tulasnella calospora MUT 4182]